MNPEDIILKYYKKDGEAFKILHKHSVSVAEKALAIADAHPEMNLDKTFIYEAAMLHDIGIFKTDAPEIFCFGKLPYICHGYLGSEILVSEGFPRHALVCERHTGVGIDLKTIIEKDLPLPHRDMKPVSLEEQIICYADKFFSKTRLKKIKSVEKILRSLSKHGMEAVIRFEEMHAKFGEKQVKGIK
jgi:uncharacterized protein